MIKSTITADCGEQGIEYPCLRFDPSDGEVVLFTEESEGTTVHGGTRLIDRSGHYSDDWDMSLFKPFNGTITLTNQP